MVDTRSAGPSEDQTIGSTVRAKVAGDSSQRDYVAETPQAGPPNNQEAKNEDANVQLQDDNALYESVHTPASSVHEDEVMADAAPPQINKNDEQTRMDEEIARLETAERLATTLQKLSKWLRVLI